MKVTRVTVLICTYNRCQFLRDTLRAILSAPRRSDYVADVIVVDNNSTDATRAAVEEAAADAPIRVRYAFEGRQGKSFALNRGLQLARGEVIAHTDDDVWPEPGWLDRIVDAFRASEISFAFGKVLPRWAQQPPPELLMPRAHEIWGPLAILDYGDEPSWYVPETPQRLPIGANLAFRRQTLLDIGGWRTDLGKVDNTLISGEDHEIFHRLQRRGLFRGLYDPAIAVRHYVPAARLTRRYFRRWFYWHGKTLARMPQEILYDLDFRTVPHVAGVPRFLYRQFLQQAGRYLGRLGNRDGLSVLIEELQTIEHVGYFVQCWQWSSKGRKRQVELEEATSYLDPLPPEEAADLVTPARLDVAKAPPATGIPLAKATPGADGQRGSLSA